MKTARIFEDVGGYYVCDDADDFLDARGRGYQTKAAALRAAWESGYDRAIGSGCYRPGKISTQIDTEDLRRF
jgi:hypothetical protein